MLTLVCLFVSLPVCLSVPLDIPLSLYLPSLSLSTVPLSPPTPALSLSRAQQQLAEKQRSEQQRPNKPPPGVVQVSRSVQASLCPPAQASPSTAPVSFAATRRLMTGNTRSTGSLSFDHKAGESEAVENAGRVKPNMGRQVEWVHGATAKPRSGQDVGERSFNGRGSGERGVRHDGGGRERWGGDGTSGGGASDLGGSGGGSGGGWREANVGVGAVGAVGAGATAESSDKKAQASAIGRQAAIFSDVQVRSQRVVLTMSVFTFRFKRSAVVGGIDDKTIK